MVSGVWGKSIDLKQWGWLYEHLWIGKAFLGRIFVDGFRGLIPCDRPALKTWQGTEENVDWYGYQYL